MTGPLSGQKAVATGANSGKIICVRASRYIDGGMTLYAEFADGG